MARFKQTLGGEKMRWAHFATPQPSRGAKYVSSISEYYAIGTPCKSNERLEEPH